ncbi:hypothetical protein TeGR_g6698 [Tetraparma gracilis]|uniref:Uncharacterized protein n=1 Tax=Tetraparma gracilis TaxID=2962635 RepID=A0ABQ6N074_9STRA|nr:hypothetical protein TeGR_g6698 [Tetraparma gracilis]
MIPRASSLVPLLVVCLLLLLSTSAPLAAASRVSPRVAEAKQRELFAGLTDQDESTIFALTQQDVKIGVIAASIDFKKTEAEIHQIASVLVERHEEKLRNLSPGRSSRQPNKDKKNARQTNADKKAGAGKNGRAGKNSTKDGSLDYTNGKGRQSEREKNRSKEREREQKEPDYKREARERRGR